MVFEDLRGPETQTNLRLSGLEAEHRQRISSCFCDVAGFQWVDNLVARYRYPSRIQRN